MLMRREVVRIWCAAVLGAALILGGATSASAGFGHSVGGGTWNYFVDVNGKVNASEYYHPKDYHRATVQNPGYGTVRDYARGGLWATAYQHSYAYGNKAYWYRY
jgi:hypothetical protein